MKVATVTTLPPPGVETDRDMILTALPGYEVAHFACHGLTDWDDPSSSRLLLHDHRTHPLTVTDIAGLRLTRTRLAYLSVCSTTGTNLQHADEAVHLTAAFHLAGYSSVIGTLWPINDRNAITIARHVYDYLTQEHTVPPRTHLAAEALHHAVRRYRDNHPRQPIQWAAYVHTGH
ncbi:hypothetical protein ALI144C_04490 [Actinosynnema sp. ALI-1.44]|nr:hypothetical protein ALI144C_04490 [Actinosynnema sp. ALI-1.44]